MHIWSTSGIMPVYVDMHKAINTQKTRGIAMDVIKHQGSILLTLINFGKHG